MKNQLLLSITTTVILAFTLSSCSKEDVCQTCTLDHSPSIRVEVCPDKATTYDGNSVILEGDLGGLSVAFYTSTLETSGYKCK